MSSVCCYDLSAIRRTRGFGIAAWTLRGADVILEYYWVDTDMCKRVTVYVYV